MEKIEIGGIIYKRHLSKIGVLSSPDRPGLAATILDALGQARVNVQFIVQLIDLKQYAHVVFCVDQADEEASVKVLEGVKENVKAEAVTHEGEVGTISIFGPDFRERPGIAGTMFRALASKEINILAISTSISTVTCVIEGARVDDAIMAVNEVFTLPGQSR